MRTPKALIVPFLAAALLITSCAAPSPATGAGETVSITAEEYENFKAAKAEEIDVLNDTIQNLKKDDGRTPDNSALAFQERPAGMLYFPIMALTEEMEPYPLAYAAIPPQDPLSSKLEQLTKSVSDILFGGLPMEVTKIREESGRKVAYIDLIGREDWTPKFQGSTGGGAASQALVMTYLQKDYTNSWIDGVHFTMDGKTIRLDHAPLLEETNFRD